MKIYYDVCNATHWGHPVQKELTEYPNAIRQIHFKDGKDGPGGAMLGEGFVPWDHVVAAVRDIRYDGWIILETSAPHDPFADAKTYLHFTKSILDWN